MSEIAIEVSDVSKLYRLGAAEEVNDSLGRTFLDYVKSPIKNYKKYQSLYRFDDVLGNVGENDDNSESNVIWALNGVSFKVNKGEVVGIIGKNGAGKSTLLKVLSKITPPTLGRVEIQGRVSSLLEVGTGFHPELTGRENVYLNGAVLGMRKKEIDAKFDEIVDFSGVEKFLYTPVKRYSSGMRVRLAFAVAAYLEPEILIIDEVLAVGDAEFQKKCINKMHEVGRQGRTVLFVSHNIQAVSRLCTRAIILNQGRLLQDGPVDDVVNAYLHAGRGTTAVREWDKLPEAPGDDIVRLRAVRVKTNDGSISEDIDIRSAVGLEMEFEVLQDGHLMMPYYSLFNEEGEIVFSAIDQDAEWSGRQRAKGKYISIAWIPKNLLAEGCYYVRATMKTLDRKKRHFNEEDIVAFNITNTDDGDSVQHEWEDTMKGVVRPLLNWETSHEPRLPVSKPVNC